jgi:hypothetical protein
VPCLWHITLIFMDGAFPPLETQFDSAVLHDTKEELDLAKFVARLKRLAFANLDGRALGMLRGS